MKITQITKLLYITSVSAVLILGQLQFGYATSTTSTVDKINRKTDCTANIGDGGSGSTAACKSKLDYYCSHGCKTVDMTCSGDSSYTKKWDCPPPPPPKTGKTGTTDASKIEDVGF